MLFRDRSEAGQRLAEKLVKYANDPKAVVLALPRGGVPVAFEVARALRIPLDVFLVRKLGLPGHEELAMGAIATGNVRILNEDVVRAMNVPDDVIEGVTREAEQELARRERLYRDDRPTPEVRGRTAILVDDGLATGSTMRAAVAAVRKKRAGHIVVAVPVGAREATLELEEEADEVVCLRTPEPFSAVGLWYNDFSQTTDEEIRDLLARAAETGTMTSGQA